ncbi:hypothetical protein SD71_01225 [Cohnella kolymensis]|uniref:Uncharacterized protein n=1 Tax=Cohnella kolymensis TaxID=1590652 RepID=A0ABR5A8E7_9BACL|nr:hypothetical protein [Cohnella kolymensis]KIL37336.1 hypothetical protein SD71_01225 [Cohnella kolymensis]
MFKQLVLSALFLTLPWSLTVKNAQAGLQTESERIISLQLDSGAIPMTPGDGLRRIEPYFANLAVIGLLESPEPSAKAAAEKWMSWYVSHLNKPDKFGLPGTVYVHEVDASGLEKSLDDYDSSDSYGATFLSVAAKYYKAGGSEAFLRSIRADLEIVAASVVATQGKDGLTRAKPNYPIAYLMDNCEVYEGLKDMAELEQTVFGDDLKSRSFKEKAARVRDGIESLWDEAAGAYQPHKGHPPQWDVFYPDATAQLFPIANGVIAPDSVRAKRLWSGFNKHHSGWTRLDTSDSFPWAAAGYVSILMGDKAATSSYYQNVYAAYMPAGLWPWHAGESGFWMRMLKMMK